MTDAPVSLLEERVDEVIAAYLEAERAGQAPTPDDLLAQHPDLADELRSFFSDRGYCFAELAQLLPPPRPATSRGKSAMTTTIDEGRYVGPKWHAGGGMGDVFIATDTELHRQIALKILKDKYAHNPAAERRFLMEAEVTARLDHPGVVPVHSLYRDDEGRLCYAMRFIEGQELAKAIQDYHAGTPDPVAFRRLLQSFIQVCETVAYAHSRGVIHRDLKPRNIKLGKFGETLVLDWGLAKIVGRSVAEQSDNLETTLRPLGDGDSDSDRTKMGDAAGTWAYMSPEQAAGRWDVINAASDVYNLGAVLYEILTGRPPLEAKDEYEMQQKIQRGDFPRPRTVKPTAPRPLEAVCLRAMAMKPEDRYPSARDLAREVEQWLADEPVKAYREPFSVRFGRWARRHKPAVAGGIALVTTALIALVASAWLITLANARFEVAEAAKKTHQREHLQLSRDLERERVNLRKLEEELALVRGRLQELESKGRADDK